MKAQEYRVIEITYKNNKELSDIMSEFGEDGWIVCCSLKSYGDHPFVVTEFLCRRPHEK
jgi:hypothetical protein